MRSLPTFAAILLLALPAFAGCFAPAADSVAPANASDVQKVAVTPAKLPPTNLTKSPVVPAKILPRIALGAHEATRDSAVLARLRPLDARPDGYDAPCDAVNCVRVPFSVELPERFWEENEGALEVTVAWGGHEAIDFWLVVEDDTGKVVTEGSGGEYASVALVPKAAAGAYVARVQATNRGASPTLAIQMEASPPRTGAPVDLLPNLVALVPKDLSLTSNNYFLNELGAQKGTIYGAAGVGSCGLDEMAEGGARRCLRFATAIGNAGDGPLEVHLSFPNDAPAIAGEGQFVQRIYRTDGTFSDTPTGKAVYHPTHRHLHYDGLAHFSLYAYDLEKQTRGASVAEGRKAGFCMVDEGLVELGALGTVPSDYSGLNCDFLDPASERLMRISRGWFDMYEVNRPDQYVEVTNLPDGVYELVAAANGLGTIVESDATDNEASVVFRLTGDTIEILANLGRQGPFAGDDGTGA